MLSIRAAELRDRQTHDVLGLASSTAMGDPDVMYYHEAMRAPDANEFKRAANAEIQSYFGRKHWKLMK